MKAVSNKLRVCHYAQIPCDPFIVEVGNEREAYLVSEALANQHLFLFEKNIIPDYCNIVSIEMWEEDFDGDGNSDWVEYYNEEEGMDFEEFCEAYLSKK